MGKIYIHIGLHKTASTYMQEKVFPYVDGIFYVDRFYTQLNTAFNSLQFSDDSSYDPNLLKNELEKIKIAAKGRPILISDEALSGCPLWGGGNRGIIAQRLAAVIPEAEIIIFMRDQVDLILSLYNQYLKQGWFSGPLDKDFLWRPGDGVQFGDWVSGDRKWNTDNLRFNPGSVISPYTFKYSEIINLYESNFQKTFLFLYEEFVVNQSDVIDKLMNVMGVVAPSLVAVPESRVNASLSERHLHRSLIGNRLNSLGLPHRGMLNRVLVRLLGPCIKKQSLDERRKYVSEVLSEYGVFDDNRSVNEDFSLEMDKHAGKYF